MKIHKLKLNAKYKEKVIKEHAEKERCVRENPLQFDSVKGYANGKRIV